MMKGNIGAMRDEEMATERWENEGGHTLTNGAIARFVRAFQHLMANNLDEVSKTRSARAAINHRGRQEHVCCAASDLSNDGQQAVKPDAE